MHFFLHSSQVVHENAQNSSGFHEILEVLAIEQWVIGTNINQLSGFMYWFVQLEMTYHLCILPSPIPPTLHDKDVSLCWLYIFYNENRKSCLEAYVA